MSFSQSKTARWSLIALRVGLGLMFVYAAWTKLTMPWIQVAMIVEGYQLLPAWAVELVAKTLPPAELVLGLWLIVGKWLPLAASASSAILLVFMVVLVRSFAKGMQIECGCFGAGDPLSAYTLARDGAFLAASLLMTWLAFRQRAQRLARNN